MNFRNDSTRPKALAMFSHSSLTDIVFLLLVFFLLTSSFVTNFGIPVDVPKADVGAPPQDAVLEVAITKDGKFYVNGKETPKTQVSEAIIEENTKQKQQTLVVRADKDGNVDGLVFVLNIGKALELKTLIATEQP